MLIIFFLNYSYLCSCSYAQVLLGSLLGCKRLDTVQVPLLIRPEQIIRRLISWAPRIGFIQEGLDALQDLAEGDAGFPVGFEQAQADLALGEDVWVGQGRFEDAYKP